VTDIDIYALYNSFNFYYSETNFGDALTIAHISGHFYNIKNEKQSDRISSSYLFFIVLMVICRTIGF